MFNLVVERWAIELSQKLAWNLDIQMQFESQASCVLFVLAKTSKFQLTQILDVYLVPVDYIRNTGNSSLLFHLNKSFVGPVEWIYDTNKVSIDICP